VPTITVDAPTPSPADRHARSSIVRPQIWSTGLCLTSLRAGGVVDGHVQDAVDKSPAHEPLVTCARTGLELSHRPRHRDLKGRQRPSGSGPPDGWRWPGPGTARAPSGVRTRRGTTFGRFRTTRRGITFGWCRTTRRGITFGRCRTTARGPSRGTGPAARSSCGSRAPLGADLPSGSPDHSARCHLRVAPDHRRRPPFGGCPSRTGETAPPGVVGPPGLDRDRDRPENGRPYRRGDLPTRARRREGHPEPGGRPQRSRRGDPACRIIVVGTQPHRRSGVRPRATGGRDCGQRKAPRTLTPRGLSSCPGTFRRAATRPTRCCRAGDETRSGGRRDALRRATIRARAGAGPGGRRGSRSPEHDPFRRATPGARPLQACSALRRAPTPAGSSRARR
jgi:hypothetical protein